MYIELQHFAFYQTKQLASGLPKLIFGGNIAIQHRPKKSDVSFCKHVDFDGRDFSRSVPKRNKRTQPSKRIERALEGAFTHAIKDRMDHLAVCNLFDPGRNVLLVVVNDMVGACIDGYFRLGFGRRGSNNRSAQMFA
ncbi:hypothetical protein AYI69_g2773 [Smittium culicis]|uniref:Uncharacterized protein n=1 Tax=Smittium culicis TaxID=133412 RepID=A0A1R1YLJ8_9FUNG|nr:hypothetical protein AYI69_g2773 [Smittium culicis]